MTAVARWWFGSLLAAMLAASLGLLIGNAVSQEREDGRPIVVKDEAPRDDAFGLRAGRERAAREHAEAERRERAERPTERDIARRQVEVLKIALKALLEAERKDAADVLQRAIRAREVALEGRRDDEAHMIRERAPSDEQLAPVLKTAAGLWREFNRPESAAVVGRLAEELARRPADRERPPQRVEERPTEREIVMRRIVEMKAALPALREGERRDAVELLERAIRGYEVTLEGRRDEEAQMIRERMPSRGQLAEILTIASNLWREFNNQDKAEVVGRLARELGAESEPDRGRPAGRRPEGPERERPRDARTAPGGQTRDDVERLRGTVRELHGQIDQMRRQMAEMQRLLKILAEQKQQER